MVHFPFESGIFPPFMAASLREVNDQSWILLGKLLIEHHDSGKPVDPPGGASWGDGEGGFYTIAQAPEPVPPSTEVLWPGLQMGGKSYHPKSRIIQIRAATHEESVWLVGQAILTVRAFNVADTKTHTTLNYLNRQSLHRLSVSIPEVLFHTEYPYDEFEDIIRHVMVTTKMEGDALVDRWPAMAEASRRKCATQAAGICKEFARFTCVRKQGITGVDGQQFHCHTLTPAGAREYKPLDLLRNWERATGDCYGPLVLDIFPNIDSFIVDAEGDIISFSDFGFCAYLPRGFVRTAQHFKTYTMLLSRHDGLAWGRLFDQKLREAGFPKFDDEALKEWREKSVKD